MRYKLQDICNMQSGGTPKRGVEKYYNGTIPWATITDFGNTVNEEILETKEYITQLGLASINNRLFKKGTLLLAMYGSVGKTAISGIELSTNQAILGIKAKDESILNIRFLKYWFDYNKAFIYSQGKGATLHNISLTVVKRQIIELPDIQTQNKIVVLLDKTSLLVRKREESIELLDKLVRATFLDMFGDPIKSTRISTRIPIGKLGDWKSGGTPSRGIQEYFTGEIPWVTSGELNEIYIDNTKEKITQKALENSNAKLIEIGSLLLGMYDTAALKSSITKRAVACNQAIAYTKLNDTLCDTHFVYYNIQLGKDYFKSQQRGVRQQNLNLSMIKGIEILYPSLAKQKEFSNIVINVLSKKQHLIQSQNQIFNLTKSIFQKAFNSQLSFNIDFELDALIREIDMKNKENDLSKIVSDIAYLQRLIDKLNSQEFIEKDLYDKAKHGVFQLLKAGDKVEQIVKKTKVNDIEETSLILSLK